MKKADGRISLKAYQSPDHPEMKWAVSGPDEVAARRWRRLFVTREEAENYFLQVREEAGKDDSTRTVLPSSEPAPLLTSREGEFRAKGVTDAPRGCPLSTGGEPCAINIDPWRAKVADRIHGMAQWLFFVLATGVLGVVPWLFGGNGPDGYWWIVWSGRFAILPLLLWMVGMALRRETFGIAFWLPVILWGMLAVQVIASTYNKSSVPVAPWLGNGFEAVPHDGHWPSTAFKQGTEVNARLWLSLGLLGLVARNVGCGCRQRQVLLWVYAGIAGILAAVGIPFKFSGEKLILGRWPAPDWYFYSTFLYHNHWCAYALLGVAVGTALFVRTSSVSLRSILVVIVIIIAGSAPLSISRLGTIAMAVFAILILTITVIRKREPFEQRPKVQPPLIIAALFGVLFVAGGAWFLYKAHGAPGGHRTWTRIWHSEPFGIRQTLIEDTLPMIREKPWFGWGLGGYGGAFRFYQRTETRIENQRTISLYDHPHNDWLETIAELGLVGSLLFWGPGLVWLRLAIPFSARSAQDKWVLIGCAGLMVFALGDNIFINRAVASSFAILFPLALRR